MRELLAAAAVTIRTGQMHCHLSSPGLTYRAKSTSIADLTLGNKGGQCGKERTKKRPDLSTTDFLHKVSVMCKGQVYDPLLKSEKIESMTKAPTAKSASFQGREPRQSSS